MSYIGDTHSRRCSLCARFLRRQKLNVYDFNAEPLAAECPYYQLQQGLIELILGPEAARWRQAIDWEPTPSNRTGYVARMRSHDYTYEYWDVYLEPGRGDIAVLSSCLKLMIYVQVQHLCQDLRTRPNQETIIIAQRLSISSSDAGRCAGATTPTVGMTARSVFYLRDSYGLMNTALS